MEKEGTLLLTSLKENYKLFEDYTNFAVLSDNQKEELREKNKVVIEGYKEHVNNLVDKLNEVKGKIK